MANCIIDPTRSQINVQKLSSIFLSSSISISSSTYNATSAPPSFTLFQDKCALNVQAIKVSSSKIFLSQSDIANSNQTGYYDLSGLGISLSNGFNTATLTAMSSPRSAVNFLINGVIVTALNTSSNGIIYASGIPPGVALTSLKSVDFCDESSFIVNPINEYVVAWTGNVVSQSTSATFYLSTDSGKTFTSFSVSLGQPSVGGVGYISDIVIQPVYSNLCILLRDNAGNYKTVLFDLLSNSLTASGYSFSTSSNLISTTFNTKVN